MSDTFPVVTSVLWERSAQNPSITLHSASALPRLQLSESVIRKHVGRLLSDAHAGAFQLVGTTTVNSLGESQWILNDIEMVDKLQPQQSKLCIPLNVTVLEDGKSRDAPSRSLAFGSESYKQAIVDMDSAIQQNKSSNATNWTCNVLPRCKAHFSAVLNSFSIRFELFFPSFSLSLTPLLPLRIESTHLSATFTQASEFDMGVLSMDAVRRLLVMPNSSLLSQPLVGIWIRGLLALDNPALYAASMWFLRASEARNRVLVAPNTFLLVLFNGAQTKFYEVKLVSDEPKTRLAEYRHSMGLLPQLDWQLDSAPSPLIHIDMMSRPLLDASALSDYAKALVYPSRTFPSAGDSENVNRVNLDVEKSLPIPKKSESVKKAHTQSAEAVVNANQAVDVGDVSMSRIVTIRHRVMKLQRQQSVNQKLNAIRDKLSEFSCGINEVTLAPQAVEAMSTWTATQSSEHSARNDYKRFHSSFFSVTEPAMYLPFLCQDDAPAQVESVIKPTLDNFPEAAVQPILQPNNDSIEPKTDLKPSATSVKMHNALRSLNRWTQNVVSDTASDSDGQTHLKFGNLKIDQPIVQSDDDSDDELNRLAWLQSICAPASAQTLAIARRQFETDAAPSRAESSALMQVPKRSGLKSIAIPRVMQNSGADEYSDEEFETDSDDEVEKIELKYLALIATK